MIYLFTWANEYLLQEEICRWKKEFISKHSDFNLQHVKDVESFDLHQLWEEVLTEAFMSTKKLVIIEEIPASRENKWSHKIYSDHLAWIVQNIPENNIVVFSSTQPDKTWKLYKALHKIAKIKVFEDFQDFALKKYLLDRFGWVISESALSLLMRYKLSSTRKIISEIEKLSILCETIEVDDVKDFVVPELEESIFHLIDDILMWQKYNALEKISIILDQVNLYVLYNGLLANLRVNIYILYAKQMWMSANEISDEFSLWNRAFLINKRISVPFKRLEKLYKSLIEIDWKMKTWNLISADESWFRFALEYALLTY